MAICAVVYQMGRGESESFDKFARFGSSFVFCFVCRVSCPIKIVRYV